MISEEKSIPILLTDARNIDAATVSSPEHLRDFTDKYYDLETAARGLIKLLPVDADGAPDIEAARHGEPLTEPPDPEDGPANDEEAARWCIETLAFGPDMDDASRFIVRWDGDNPVITQISGPEIDAHVLDLHIARRLGRTGRRLGPATLLPPREAAEQSVAGDRFNFTWFGDIDETKPRKAIVEGFLYEDEFTGSIGKPSAGKSVIATDIGFHVSARRSWHGRKVKGGLVVYFAAERAALTKRRVAALRKRYDVVQNIPFVVASGKLDLTSNLVDARDLAEAIRGAERRCGERCVLIIIDTLSRTFGAADQNASKDMNKFTQACDELRRLIGAHIYVIHHSTWGESRGKGAIDFDAAIDASFEVARNGDTISLICTGANDGEEGPILHYRLESETIGEDQAGEPITAPIVVSVEGSGPIKFKTRAMGPALQALRDEVAENGVDPGGAPGYPAGVRIVGVVAWRERFRKSQPTGDKADTVLKRFNSARTLLLADKSVTQVGEWYFPTPAGKPD